MAGLIPLESSRSADVKSGEKWSAADEIATARLSRGVSDSAEKRMPSVNDEDMSGGRVASFRALPAQFCTDALDKELSLMLAPKASL